MQKPTLIFENSPLFLAACIVLGLAYAYLLYSKKSSWGIRTDKILFALRFILASAIAALLISPVLKQVQNTVEQPAYVIAIDNSQSIKSATDSLELRNLVKKLKAFGDQLSENGFEVSYQTSDGGRYESIDDIEKFNHSGSDLASFLSDIAGDYEGRNLGGVTLVSDGIYNQGISPTYRSYNFRLATIGIGDSVPKSDISINDLVYNKISYQGNKFPLVAKIKSSGFEGERVNVSVSKGSEVLVTESITLARDNSMKEVKFLLDADENGFQRYRVNVTSFASEYTTLNNSKQAYIEVIEGTENIAMIAAAPHPDIKAIRSAVESNSNYSFDQYILSLAEDRNRLKQNTKQYDLLVLHQLPDSRGYHRLVNLWNTQIPKLFIYGGLTDIRNFNTKNEVLAIDAVPGEYDQVNASFNQAFVNFTLSEDLQQTFTELPPITVPFGKTNMNRGSKILLFQQVGSIVTAKPLIAINEELDNKEAVVLGDGLWQWKLTSYVINESHKPFNELVTSLIQFLSSKEDKRKFKVYPVKNEYTTGEQIVFDTEVYNDLYERVYGNKINLTLKNNDGDNFNYTFVTNENNTRYSITGIPEGVYSYTATSQLAEENVSTSGELIVRDLEIENVNLTADFGLLRNLSSKSGGYFTYYKDFNPAKETTLEATGVIHSTEKYLPFINLKWLFFVFLGMIALEWFIRKFSGSY